MKVALDLSVKAVLDLLVKVVLLVLLVGDLLLGDRVELQQVGHLVPLAWDLMVLSPL